MTKCSGTSVECIGNGKKKKYRCVVPADKGCPLGEGCPLRNEFFPPAEFKSFRKMAPKVMPPGTRVTYSYTVGVEEVEITGFTFRYYESGRRQESLDCTYTIYFSSNGETRDGISPSRLEPLKPLEPVKPVSASSRSSISNSQLHFDF